MEPPTHVIERFNQFRQEMVDAFRKAVSFDVSEWTDHDLAHFEDMADNLFDDLFARYGWN